MSMRFTILGCGSSGGVPRVGNVWGNCDPTNPKNRRRRCALLVERFGKQGRTTVLVDTPSPPPPNPGAICMKSNTAKCRRPGTETSAH